MKDVLGATHGYHLSKLYELGSRGGMDREVIKKLHFSSVKDRIETYKKQILNKYGTMDDLSGLKIVFDDIEYVLKRIDSYFDGQYDEREAYIMVYSLDHLCKDLINMAQEIDVD